jgi:hypothetical protein
MPPVDNAPGHPRVAPDPPILALLRGRLVALEAANIELQNRLAELAQVKADVSLQNLVDSVGLAASLGEATMPDRTIDSITLELKSYLTVEGGSVGIRFQQPELGVFAVGLATTSIELAKVPPRPGDPPPPNLVAVLAEKQSVFTSLSTRSREAAAVVALVTVVLSNTGGWNLPYLIQESAAIVALESQLTPFLTQVAPAGAVQSFAAAVQDLQVLTTALSQKPRTVASDLLALARALDATTRAARRAIA